MSLTNGSDWEKISGDFFVTERVTLDKYEKEFFGGAIFLRIFLSSGQPKSADDGECSSSPAMPFRVG